MKKLLLLPLFVLFATTLQAEPILYKPTGWVLGVVLPGPPQDVSENKTPVPQGEIVEKRAGFREDEETYVVERILFPTPEPLQNHDAAYEGGKKAMQEGNPRTLKSEEKTMICGHEGRRYVLEDLDSKHVTDHRVVIIGEELYIFIYERPTTQSPSADAGAFFSKITDKKA